MNIIKETTKSKLELLKELNTKDLQIENLENLLQEKLMDKYFHCEDVNDSNKRLRKENYKLRKELKELKQLKEIVKNQADEIVKLRK